MNLLEDQWLKVIHKDSQYQQIQGLWNILDQIDSNNPVVDIISPRADFKGALYQFFIGLIQTTFAPEDEDEWEEFWYSPPTTEQLKTAFLTVKEAFEINTNNPAFMQDYELLNDKKEVDIAALLVDTMGGGTFFIKEGVTKNMSPYWANIALFTLQINAPAGGSGHRTSLRGGGPLTTLLLPNETENPASLWQKLWLNILTQEEIELPSKIVSPTSLSSIFPWLAPTRTSEKGGKTFETYPEQVHPYQVYWGMPRRIRLNIEKTDEGQCDVSHEQSAQLISCYRTQNLGVNYSSTWFHPLTPYVRLPNKEPYSVKAQVGGFSYRHWLGLVLDDVKNHKQKAKIMTVYLKSRKGIIEAEKQPRLWLFGYDMDNMKPRCWYESTLPIFDIPSENLDELQNNIAKMINAATEVALDIRSTLKQAWFISPKEAKGDINFTDSQFWEQTETKFYQLLEQLIQLKDDEDKENQLRIEWKQHLRQQALTLFDHWALSSNNEDGDMKRVVIARRQLEIFLYAGKQMKALATY